MLIQVDVDSTLYDADKLFKQVAEEFGVDWWAKAPRWFGPEDIGTDLNTLKNIFKRAHSKEYVLKNKPYPYAADALRYIVDIFPDTQIAYVSDRNVAQSTALREWLEENNFLHSAQQVVKVTQDKREWMRDNRPNIVIDDRVRTILMARYELGAYVATLEHPHNINLRGETEKVYFAKNWTQMQSILEEIVQKASEDPLRREFHLTERPGEVKVKV